MTATESRSWSRGPTSKPLVILAAASRLVSALRARSHHVVARAYDQQQPCDKRWAWDRAVQRAKVPSPYLGRHSVHCGRLLSSTPLLAMESRICHQRSTLYLQRPCCRNHRADKPLARSACTPFNLALAFAPASRCLIRDFTFRRCVGPDMTDCCFSNQGKCCAGPFLTTAIERMRASETQKPRRSLIVSMLTPRHRQTTSCFGADLRQRLANYDSRSFMSSRHVVVDRSCLSRFRIRSNDARKSSGRRCIVDSNVARSTFECTFLCSEY
jgi:hypothetical protein